MPGSQNNAKRGLAGINIVHSRRESRAGSLFPNLVSGRDPREGLGWNNTHLQGIIISYTENISLCSLRLSLVYLGISWSTSK